MAAKMKGRSLLTLKDYSPEEIRILLDVAHRVKKESRAGSHRMRFSGKTLALLFEKRSTRTRCAFETAFGEEGGHPVFLTTQDIHLGEKESVEDTARVLGRMFDGIMFRGFRQQTAEILARDSGVPVYNALTDSYHPTQALADLMTMEEVFGKRKPLHLSYVGDGRNNMAVSLLIACPRMGITTTIVAPPSLFPSDDLVDECRAAAKAHGAGVKVTSSVEEGVLGADVVYTDVWVSMGEEEKKTERLEILSPYQVNGALMAATGKKETIFLHCLPAVKGEEVTAGVFEGPRSHVFDQAENRKHTIKALLLCTLTGK